jgi:hypothetical protein
MDEGGATVAGACADPAAKLCALAAYAACHACDVRIPWNKPLPSLLIK